MMCVCYRVWPLLCEHFTQCVHPMDAVMSRQAACSYKDQLQPALVGWHLGRGVGECKKTMKARSDAALAHSTWEALHCSCMAVQGVVALHP